MRFLLPLMGFIFFSTMSLNVTSVKAEAFIVQNTTSPDSRSFLSNGEQDESLLELYLGVELDDFIEDRGFEDYNELLNIPDSYMKKV